MSHFEQDASLNRKLYYDGDSVAMLLGEATRVDNKKFIYQSFPFMRNYSIDSIQNQEHLRGINEYQIQTAIRVFASTPNPIVLTEKDKEEIRASDDPYEEIIESKVMRIIGDAYSDKGCVGLDAINGVEDDILGDRTRTVSRLYENMQGAAYDSVMHLLGILLCERDGKIGRSKCDAEDFVSTPSDYTPSTDLTEEEKAILAERERDGQESSGATETSNVMPLQLCSSLGQVVQTESYGQLTCKYVILNRIRTLAWMRG